MLKKTKSEASKDTKKELTRFSFAMPILKCYEEVIKGDDGKEEKKKFIEGVASSTDKDLHGDVMSPDAIKSMADSIKKHRIELNAEHDKSWQSDLGGVEKLSVNKKNQLVMKAKLDITSKATDLWYALTVKKKELGLSIGGFVKDYKLTWDKEQERFSRVFKEIELDHIAVTSTPANPKTWVGAVSKSVDRAERLNQVDLKDMSKEVLEKFVDKIVASFGGENLNKILTNFSLNLNNETIMAKTKKDSSLESEKAKKTSAEAKDKEANKDASESMDEKEDANSENQDNEDDNKTDESNDDSKDDETSDSDASEDGDSKDDESDEDSTEEDDSTEDETDEDTSSSEKDEEDSEGSSDDDSDEDNEDKDEEKSLTRKEVVTIVNKAIEKGIREFLSNLLGKGNKNAKKIVENKKECKSSVEVSFGGKETVEMLKTIAERQDKIEKMFKKKAVNRKTVNSVAINKDDENVDKTKGDGFESLEAELESVKKTHSVDPARAFAECGKVRRKWTDKE